MAKATRARVTRRASTAAGSEPHEPGLLPQPGFPIVGIGASAGGLAAFEAFFSGMPAGTDVGMAFVLVQHLAPDHKSILADLVRHYTRMEVFEVEDGMAVKADCAYIIPPNRDMAILNGTLHLLEQTAPRGFRLPIDFFFRSLAMDQHDRAMGIVLSGTGSDGTQGVRAIKAEGGMLMAQTPESAEYQGMPCSAIDTGLVDYVLAPAEMPAQLAAYAAHPHVKQAQAGVIPAHGHESAYRKVLILLRDQTGHDFSQYKPTTISRRIERRLAVNQIKTVDEYVKYAQRTPAEMDALFGDLLIGVTSFFRDPEAFKALEEQVIPKLFAGKPSRTTIRVWSPGCSTGEEAYSLAILLRERLDTLEQGYRAQVFATDLQPQAVATARTGVYPAGIAADVSPDRLERFFTGGADGSAYGIRKSIRELLIFSEQDVTRDPPLSKVDLIVCRNLLIYMSGDLQRRLIPLFHYALNPGGFLFLGPSETIGQHGELFAVVDRKWRLYQRKADKHRVELPSPAWSSLPARVVETRSPRAAARTRDPRRPSVRELAEHALLRQVSPPGALVNARGDILYLHGRTGSFLEPASGEAGVNNIVMMAREGLQGELAAALRQAAKSAGAVRRTGLRVRTNGGFSTVDLIIHPVTADPGTELEAPLYLVTLQVVPGVEAECGQKAGPSGPSQPEGHGTHFDPAFDALREELRAKEELLQTANEELETSNEEMQSANEELESTNEELQSTNEELETSREELQSINEELATTNAELQTKLVDLSRANDDMKNLLAGTGIRTLFVDRDLRILRFTPGVTGIIDLIPCDVGQPLARAVPNLMGYDRLVADAEAVLETLAPRESEVETKEGRWYTMRMLPYRTLENVVEGVVITFADITEVKQARAELEDARAVQRLAIVARDSSDALAVRDLEGRVLAWNPAAERMYGWTEAEALEMHFRGFMPEDRWEEEFATVRKLAEAGDIEPYHAQRITKTGAVIGVLARVAALIDESGAMYAIATTERRMSSTRDSR